MYTYVSLFSSAGIGCFGFKQENFECVATNELIERRLNIQMANHKCKYQSGYICGDITQELTKKKLFNEINLWKEKDNLAKLDVLIATPPCQGMSVANQKKTNKEITRNSLVIESIKIICELQPKIFIFENVPAFMKTLCTDIDGTEKTISEAIEIHLGNLYSYTYKIINFKNYGACSSRQRTIVIGVLKEYSNEISPFELFPKMQAEKTLRSVIGHLRPLTHMGEIDPNDIYHQFRSYPEYMRKWISPLKEGESAFENTNDNLKPHQIINGQIVLNKEKNGDKYKRQFWDKVGPCIHTRNDQLASQNTIHPEDDRVFSIRELMLMMTVPEDFNWTTKTFSELNLLKEEDKKQFLKKEEIKIRQSLGEAVPTVIFQNIAQNIKKFLSCRHLTLSLQKEILKKIKDYTIVELKNFISINPYNLSTASLSRIMELINTHRIDCAAYFTNKFLTTEICKELPDFDEMDTLHVLEPSVGIGNLLPILIERYSQKKVFLDLVDIDKNSLELLKELIKKMSVPQNWTIHYYLDDFLLHNFKNKYDLIIGNPPFGKLESNCKKLHAIYKKEAVNKNTNNICSFFLDKALKITGYLVFVFPKFLLNTPEFKDTRAYLQEKSIECILDFGEKGFQGVLVETIAIFINNKKKKHKTKIVSLPQKRTIIQDQKYICDPNLPYWIIYRNDFFDKIISKLVFNVFSVFRDRQITNSLLSPKENHSYRVLKSRNISESGKIENIQNYDAFISQDVASSLSVFKFLNMENVYITPNMTYKPRVIKKPKNTLVNGSVAILIPKDGIKISDKQLQFFSSEAYREFYLIARNFQTRSLNVDSCSVYFYGLLKS